MRIICTVRPFGRSSLAPVFHAVRSRRFAINASSSAGDDGESAFSGSLRKNQKPEGVQPNGSGAGGLPTQDGKFVIGGNVSEAEWRTLDKKVNKYPGQRTFTAIGSGGDEFRDAMVAAVSSVVGTVHQECVAQRPSSGGQYVSVKIGPVWVTTPEQVIEVFATMRKDTRLRWYM